jgi:nitrogen PTS system EIIA component
MKIGIRDASALLGTTEEKIRDWIEGRGLPAQRIEGEYRINRSELLEWAIANKLTLATGFFEIEEDELPPISEALESGGVLHDVAGESAAETIGEVVGRMKLADDADREMLRALFLARDGIGATAIGGGIAIPHVRTPVVLSSDIPSLTLCFLRRPLEVDAPDGQPVTALFMLISPSIRIHLLMLARLAHLLRKKSFHEAVMRQASAEELIAIARDVEQSA